MAKPEVEAMRKRMGPVRRNVDRVLSGTKWLDVVGLPVTVFLAGPVAAASLAVVGWAAKNEIQEQYIRRGYREGETPHVKVVEMKQGQEYPLAA